MAGIGILVDDGVSGGYAYKIKVPSGTLGNSVIDLSSTGSSTKGVVVGGTAGQILSKIDGTDYNTQWVDVPMIHQLNQFIGVI